MYKGYSQDYQDILFSYFGILPWDCFAYDNYMENILIDGAEIRNQVSYMKDYSLEELKKILGEDNYKLIQLMKKEK